MIRISVATFLLSAASLLFSLNAQAAKDPVPEFICPISSTWLDQPSLPTYVPVWKKNAFCPFYQASWQSFLYLTSPNAEDPSKRNFQTQAEFPELEQSGNNSCDNTVDGPTVFTRATKPTENLPLRDTQAGSGAIIYDQNGNAVFYNVRFSRNLCDIVAIQSQPNFPAGTIEIKTAWKQLATPDPDYFMMTANIDDHVGEKLLGLVGFHLVFRPGEHPAGSADPTDPGHPEFVWASFEHKYNDPSCFEKEQAPPGGWSFTSAECADPLKCLSQMNQQTCYGSECGITGTPTEVCRFYKDGTIPLQLKEKENQEDIQTINEAMVGPEGLLTTLSPDNPMHVWSNYHIIGALWLSKPDLPSSDIDNQRGSIGLASSVMETTFQDSKNCFACHQYEPQDALAFSVHNTSPQAGLSHIFDDIIAGQCPHPVYVAAEEVILSNDAAQTACANTCSLFGGWAADGGWYTENGKSRCNCCRGLKE